MPILATTRVGRYYKTVVPFTQEQPFIAILGFTKISLRQATAVQQSSHTSLFLPPDAYSQQSPWQWTCARRLVSMETAMSLYALKSIWICQRRQHSGAYSNNSNSNSRVFYQKPSVCETLFKPVCLGGIALATLLLGTGCFSQTSSP